MPNCPKCGAPNEVESNFCSTCGYAMNSAEAPQAESFTEKIKNLNNTADTTAEYDGDDITQNKAMAMLAYIGFLVLIPIFGAKNSKFARFHANQGLNLMIAEALYNVCCFIINIILGTISAIVMAISFKLSFIVALLGLISSILSLINFVFVALLIIGIVNVANGRAKELPIIGKFRILK